MQINAMTDWSRLCELSRRLCNGLQDVEHLDDLVYMATDSLGGRDMDAGCHSHEVGTFWDGVWEGYCEHGAQMFRWTSATSGAVLEARRERDGWSLTFWGEASYYICLFADAVDAATVTVIDAAGMHDVLQAMDRWGEEDALVRRDALKAIIAIDCIEMRADNA